MAPMMGTVFEEARRAPGFRDWSRAQVAFADQADAHRLALILGRFIDPTELPEAVGAVMAAGFHRS